MSVYPFLEAERVQQHSVQRACQLLEVSRAAYYSHRAGPSARERADDVLTPRIRAVHARSKGRCGAPRVHAELARRGHQHGRKRIAGLMRGSGLRGKAAKRWKRTTIPDKSAGVPGAAGIARREFVRAACLD